MGTTINFEYTTLRGLLNYTGTMRVVSESVFCNADRTIVFRDGALFSRHGTSERRISKPGTVVKVIPPRTS